jgi:hypothetical protein
LTREPSGTRGFRQQPAPDAAADRGANLREAEIEPGGARGRLRAEELAVRRVEDVAALLERLLRDVARASERRRALVVALGKRDPRLGGGDGGFGLVEGRLVRALVDGEEEIALVDDRAVAKGHRGEIAGDACANLDEVDGLEAADEIVALDHLLHDRLGDRDRRRWGVGRRLGDRKGGRYSKTGRGDERDKPTAI